MTAPSALIEPQDLYARIQSGADNLVILDASYTGDPLFNRVRIGNAQFFDIDAIADHGNPLPHMLPNADEFAAAMTTMGITGDSEIIVYDQSGIAMAASRAWWMFRVFGHDNVRVLNGGLPLWASSGLPLSSGAPTPARPAATPFRARFRPELVRGREQMRKGIDDPAHITLDARSAERFAGTADEPRPGLRPGHIPNSRNLFFGALINPHTGRLDPGHPLVESLRPDLAGKSVACTCGSGVTACVLALALYESGQTNVAVYDGSWSEWGQESLNLPVSRT